MGNHEFCTDCGASDFHHGRPCDPAEVLRYQEERRLVHGLKHDWTGVGDTCNRCRLPYTPREHNMTCPGWAKPEPPPLSFDRLRETNVRRCESAFHPLNAWSPTDWSNAMAGEVGEACNMTKKLLRGDAKTDGETRYMVGELAKEIADVVIYADLLAARLGIDLGAAVRDKFNEVSDRRGCTITL